MNVYWLGLDKSKPKQNYILRSKAYDPRNRIQNFFVTFSLFSSWQVPHPLCVCIFVQCCVCVAIRVTNKTWLECFSGGASLYTLYRTNVVVEYKNCTTDMRYYARVPNPKTAKQFEFVFFDHSVSRNHTSAIAYECKMNEYTKTYGLGPDQNVKRNKCVK